MAITNLLICKFNSNILVIQTEAHSNQVVDNFNISNIINQNIITARLYSLVKPKVGNIYYCQIVKFQQSLNCFFVYLGNNQYALLKNNKQTRKILSNPTIGQKFIGILVKEGSNSKYPIISPNVILEGLLCDFKPFSQNINFIPELTTEFHVQENITKNILSLFSNKFGISVKKIILPDLLEEIKIKTKLWDQLNSKPSKIGLIYCSYILNILYENFNNIPKNIIVNSLSLCNVIKEEIKNTLPFLKVNITYNNSTTIFLNYILKLEEIVTSEYIINNEITLHIFNTRALNFIDIDYKGISSFNKEISLFKANILSINYIVPLIKLRNLSGQIFIDTLKIKSEIHKSIVLNQYKEILKKYGINAKVMGFTKLGVLEIVRTKKYNSINDSFFQECDKCGGNGKILNNNILYLKAIMQVNQIVNKNPLAQVTIKSSESILKQFQSYNSNILGSFVKNTINFVIDNNLINTIIVY